MAYLSSSAAVENVTLTFESEAEQFLFPVSVGRAENLRARVIWTDDGEVNAPWIRVQATHATASGKLVGREMPLAVCLAEMVDVFVTASVEAIESSNPLGELARVKKECLANAEDLFAQIPENARDASIGLALILDHVRAIELIAHAVLDPASRREPIRLNRATGGLLFRSDRTPHCEFEINRRPIPSFRSDCSSLPTPDIVAAVFRTHTLALDLAQREILKGLKKLVDAEGLEMGDFAALLGAA